MSSMKCRHRLLGYWAKLQHGKKVKQTLLPAVSENVSDQIFVHVHALRQLPEEVVAAASKARESASEILVQAELPVRPHRVTIATKRALRAVKADHEQFLKTPEEPGVVMAQIGKSNIGRVLSIIEALTKYLDGLGHKGVDAKDGLDFVIDGEKMRLSFGETKGKEAHRPTTAELARKAEWERDRLRYPTLYREDKRHWAQWDHFPAGRLSLTLSNPAEFRWSKERVLGRWYDRKSVNLEKQLREVVVGMIAGAVVIRRNRLAAEERERIRQQRIEQYHREQRRLERLAKQEAFIEEKAKQYARLRQIQAFADHLANQEAANYAGSSLIKAVATQIIESLGYRLSAEVLNQEIVELGLYTDDDRLG
ncbi:hypothetical protein AAFG13_15690 [Bradyrhizobium sp. B124]|uniref:hypothetical protein n=1 Tax=Bradyrhizobium sp. B124 TaxID=3140245 RepID=UPI003183A011